MTHPGGYVQLTGNQVGVLLGHYILSTPREGEKDRLVANSIVSSPELGQIAKQMGVRFEETLTGFKWIANGAIDRAEQGEFLFGYEEALGYAVALSKADRNDAWELAT